MKGFFSDWGYLIKNAGDAGVRHFYLMLAIIIPVLLIGGIIGLIFGIKLHAVMIVILSGVALISAIATLIWMAVSN